MEEITPIADKDARWKIIIEQLFEDFVDFFRPDLSGKIDFSKGVIFLEQELHQILPDWLKGTKNYTDKLAKVTLKTGEEQCLFIHTEVQGKHETYFNERMFVYYYRIYDKFGKNVTALAIFTNKTVPKHHNIFEHTCEGTSIRYQYHTYLIRDKKEEDLINNPNPFALVTLACKYLIEAKNDNKLRLKFKQKLFRLLLERSYEKDVIHALLKFITFTIALPANLELKFQQDMAKILSTPMEGIWENMPDFLLEAIEIKNYGSTRTEALAEQKKQLIKEKEVALKEIKKAFQKAEKQRLLKLEREKQAVIEKERQQRLAKELEIEQERQQRLALEQQKTLELEQARKQKALELEQERAKAIKEKNQMIVNFHVNLKISAKNIANNLNLSESYVKEVIEAYEQQNK